MAGILIVAHMPLASALVKFVEHVYGELPKNILALDVVPHEDSKGTLKRMEDAALLISDEDGVLILVDILGATPANVAARLAALEHFHSKVQIIAGVNLPMLLRAVSHRHEPLDALVEIALQGGQQGVVRLRENTKVTFNNL